MSKNFLYIFSKSKPLHSIIPIVARKFFLKSKSDTITPLTKALQ